MNDLLINKLADLYGWSVDEVINKNLNPYEIVEILINAGVDVANITNQTGGVDVSGADVSGADNKVNIDVTYTNINGDDNTITINIDFNTDVSIDDQIKRDIGISEFVPLSGNDEPESESESTGGEVLLGGGENILDKIKNVFKSQGLNVKSVSFDQDIPIQPENLSNNELFNTLKDIIFNFGLNDNEKSKLKTFDGDVNRLNEFYKISIPGENLNNDPETKHRLAFISKVLGVINNNVSSESQNSTITLRDLIGDTSIYTNAIIEEKKDKGYLGKLLATLIYDIDIDIDKETDEQITNKFNKKLVMWIAGPSASGKTTAAKYVLKQLLKSPKDYNLSDYTSTSEGVNKFIFIDGAVERDISQVRKLLIKLAVAKGYTGISDLSESGLFSTNYEGSKLKEKIHKLADDLDDYGIIIPTTFAPKGPTTIAFGAEIDRFERYSQQDINHFFSAMTPLSLEYEVNTKLTTQYMGDRRAFLQKGKDFKNINDKIGYITGKDTSGIESKVYDPNSYDKGVKWAKSALDNYINYMKKYNKDGVYIKISNDLVRTYFDESNILNMCEFNKPCPANVDVKTISKKYFDEYNKLTSPLLNEFDDWIKTKDKVFYIDVCIGDNIKECGAPQPLPSPTSSPPSTPTSPTSTPTDTPTDTPTQPPTITNQDNCSLIIDKLKTQLESIINSVSTDNDNEWWKTCEILSEDFEQKYATKTEELQEKHETELGKQYEVLSHEMLTGKTRLTDEIKKVIKEKQEKEKRVEELNTQITDIKNQVTNLTRTNKEQQASLRQKENDIAINNVTNAEHQVRMNELINLITSSTETENQLKNKIDVLNGQIAELREASINTEEQNKQLVELQTRLDETIAKLKETQEIVQGYRTENNELNSEIQRLTKLNEILSTQTEKFSKQSEKYVETINLNTLQIAKYEKEIAEYETQAEQIMDKLKASKENIEKLEKEKKDLEATIEQYNQKINSLTTTIEELESTKSEHLADQLNLSKSRNELKQVNDKLAKSQQDLATSEEENVKLTTQLQYIKSHIKELIKDKEALEKENQTLSKEISELKPETLISPTATSEETNQQLVRLNQQINKLTQEKSDLEQQIAKLKETEASLNAQLKEIEQKHVGDISFKKQQYKDLSKEFIPLKEQFEEKQQECDELKNKVEELEKKIKETIEIQNKTIEKQKEIIEDLKSKIPEEEEEELGYDDEESAE